MSSSIQLPSYEISRCFLKENCTMQYITGDFACLSAYFELTRSKKYYILNIYLPSILCVIIASTSFWVQLDIAPARVALGITTFLTMVIKIIFLNFCQGQGSACVELPFFENYRSRWVPEDILKV